MTIVKVIKKHREENLAPKPPEVKEFRHSHETAILFDGKLFKLIPTEFVDAGAFLEESVHAYMEELSNTMEKYRQDCNTAMRIARQSKGVSIVPPDYDFVIENEMRICTNGIGGVMYILPFHYHAKYKDGRKIISPETKKFEKNVFIAFHYSPIINDDENGETRSISNIELIDEDGTSFKHYHSTTGNDNNQHNCLGSTFKYDQYCPVTDLPELRDKIEYLFENINTSSLNRDAGGKMSKGLPALSEIRTEEKTTVGWDRKVRPINEWRN